MTKRSLSLLRLVAAIGLLALAAAAGQNDELMGQTMLRAAPATTPDMQPDAEIVLLEPNGRIRVDDPFVAPGIKPAFWNSGSDIGWSLVAAGDFNGDGDAEIAATRGGALKVFDPLVQAGSTPVSFAYTLPLDHAFRLLVAGDFDNDGCDEIATVHADSGAGVVDSITVFDGGPNGAIWNVVWGAQFAVAWQDMAVGDFNNDGHADLALVRNSDGQIAVYKGGPVGLTPLATQGSYPADWLAAAGGNIFAGYAGDEIALARNGANGQINALILLRVSGSALVDSGGDANYKYNPEFTSLALGDLNGDGDDEVLMLRDPADDRVSLHVVNPAGAAMRAFSQAIGHGSTAWKLVRAGDTDGDGRAEIVIERGDGYRIYTAPDADDAYIQVIGSLYTTSAFTNLPTMAVANIDGPGAPLLAPTLGVSPAILTFDAMVSQPSPPQTVQIVNSGTSSEIAWQAEVIAGATWLKIDETSGVTPAGLGVSIDTGAVAPGMHLGRIRVRATTAGVLNSPQEVMVMLHLQPGAEPTPTPTATPTATATATPTPTPTPARVFLPLVPLSQALQRTGDELAKCQHIVYNQAAFVSQSEPV